MLTQAHDVLGKGTLDAIHTGGGIHNLVGDVKDLTGNNVYVLLGEEGDILMIKKNPLHEGFDREYVDSATYGHEDLGERFYFGYESDLQTEIVFGNFISGKFVVTSEGMEVFGKEVAEELFNISTKFMMERFSTTAR